MDCIKETGLHLSPKHLYPFSKAPFFQNIQEGRGYFFASSKKTTKKTKGGETRRKKMLLIRTDCGSVAWRLWGLFLAGNMARCSWVTRPWQESMKDEAAWTVKEVLAHILNLRLREGYLLQEGKKWLVLTEEKRILFIFRQKPLILWLGAGESSYNSKAQLAPLCNYIILQLFS